MGLKVDHIAIAHSLQPFEYESRRISSRILIDAAIRCIGFAFQIAKTQLMEDNIAMRTLLSIDTLQMLVELTFYEAGSLLERPVSYEERCALWPLVIEVQQCWNSMAIKTSERRLKELLDNLEIRDPLKPTAAFISRSPEPGFVVCIRLPLSRPSEQRSSPDSIFVVLDWSFSQLSRDNIGPGCFVNTSRELVTNLLYTLLKSQRKNSSDVSTESRTCFYLAPKGSGPQVALDPVASIFLSQLQTRFTTATARGRTRTRVEASHAGEPAPRSCSENSARASVSPTTVRPVPPRASRVTAAETGNRSRLVAPSNKAPELQGPMRTTNQEGRRRRPSNVTEARLRLDEVEYYSDSLPNANIAQWAEQVSLVEPSARYQERPQTVQAARPSRTNGPESRSVHQDESSLLRIPPPPLAYPARNQDDQPGHHYSERHRKHRKHREQRSHSSRPLERSSRQDTTVLFIPPPPETFDSPQYPSGAPTTIPGIRSNSGVGPIISSAAMQEYQVGDRGYYGMLS